MNLFAHHFLLHVMPKLREAVRLQAVSVATGDTSFTDACDAVLSAARRYGATYLPERLRFEGRTIRPLLELEDWISTNLLKAIVEAEQQAAAVARHEVRNPVAHYSKLTAGCHDPDRIQWVFAAISPQYRAHLQAVRRERV